MKLTPAIKGQLTKALTSYRRNMAMIDVETCLNFAFGAARSERQAVIAVFAKHMPKEQAKHATRKYLASINA